MHTRTVFQSLVHHSCALFILIVLLVPSTAAAQQQGGGNTRNSVQSWVDRLLGGPQDTTAPTTPTAPIGVPGGFSWFGGNGGTQTQGTGSITDAAGSVINLFTNNPVVNGVLDLVIGLGNETQVWPNGSGNPILDGAANIIVDGITAVVNTFTGEVHGDPVQTGVIQDADITGSHYEVNTADGTVTEYDEHGNAVRSNDSSRQGGGSSGGPSIPGASRGTVGNPFSDGTDKNDAPSDNDETTSNPYLFEYDPSSTNNNPSGAGSMDR